MKEFNLLINGRLTPGALTMNVVNPATGEAFAASPRADAKQLDAAVQAAKAAFPAWSRLNVAARRAKIMAIADGIEGRLDELARLLTAEQGKPLRDAMGEVGGAAAILRVLASLELPNKVLLDDAKEKIIEHRTHLGVVACNEHLPPGVFNVITDQNDLGALLTKHPDVAKVSFTGSTATGKKVMESAASSLKRVTLELGGNDAAIVLDDVDPKIIAPKLFAGAMLNSGQVCLAIKRIYVHESQYESVCGELAELADAAVVGNGMHDATQYGPLQNKTQFEKVGALMEQTHRDGQFIAGGRIGDGPGYFIRPSIVRDISDGARLVREEQFGPVVPVLRYKHIDEAVARANDTTYGLGGTVWSADPERALEVAMKVDSGIMWVNQHMNFHMDIPAGGSKQSGIGAELGLEGLAEFSQNHVVYVAK